MCLKQTQVVIFLQNSAFVTVDEVFFFQGQKWDKWVIVDGAVPLKYVGVADWLIHGGGGSGVVRILREGTPLPSI